MHIIELTTPGTLSQAPLYGYVMNYTVLLTFNCWSWREFFKLNSKLIAMIIGSLRYSIIKYSIKLNRSPTTYSEISSVQLCKTVSL